MNPFTWCASMVLACTSIILWFVGEPRASRLVFVMAVGGALFWVGEGVLAALRGRCKPSPAENARRYTSEEETW